VVWRFINGDSAQQQTGRAFDAAILGPEQFWWRLVASKQRPNGLFSKIMSQLEMRRTFPNQNLIGINGKTKDVNSGIFVFESPFSTAGVRLAWKTHRQTIENARPDRAGRA
jgi:hypothetical protein